MRSKKLLAIWLAVPLLVATVASAQRNSVVEVNGSGELHYFANKGMVTVRTVTMQFYPANGRLLSDPADRGKQIVRVEVSVSNTGDGDLRVSYTSFTIKTSDGEKGGSHASDQPREQYRSPRDQGADTRGVDGGRAVLRNWRRRGAQRPDAVV